MPRIVRAALFSIRDLVLSAGPFILIALALLIGAYYVLKPAPPKRAAKSNGSSARRAAIEDAPHARGHVEAAVKPEPLVGREDAGVEVENLLHRLE